MIVFQDAAIFLRDNEALFTEKISKVVISGGTTDVSTKFLRHKQSMSIGESLQKSARRKADARFLPDVSESKIHSDIPAAQYFYTRCQELGVSLIIVPPEVRSVLSSQMIDHRPTTHPVRW